MNKKDIVKTIHARVGFPKRETAAIVDTAFELMKTALAKGEPVAISAFGKFSEESANRRDGYNPCAAGDNLQGKPCAEGANQ